MPDQSQPTPPPRLAMLLLRLRFRGADGEALIGDLVEELSQRAAGLGGTRGARRWLWRQVLGSMLTRVPRRMERAAPQALGGGLGECFRRELGLAVRRSLRRPLSSAVVILTIAVGIGANTLILSVFDSVVLSPLPYPAPEELAGVYRLSPQVTGKDPTAQRLSQLYAVPYELFLDWQRSSRSFTQMGAYADDRVTLTGGEQPVRILAYQATSGVFGALRATPLLGRPLLSKDDRVGAPAAAVLSHGLWVRRFGEDPGIVGQEILLDGVPHTVVGVMPREFYFPSGNEELWITFGDAQKASTYRAGGYLQVLVRLRPGVDLAVAQAEMDDLARRLAEVHPEEREHGVRLVSRKELVVSQVRAGLLVFLGAAGMVLLIACANVAGLLFVRAVERRRELAVRVAIGAGRMHIVIGVFTESLLLSLVGGLVGGLVAVAGLRPFVAAFPGGLPRAAEITAGLQLFLIAAGLCLLTGLVIGVVPALRSARIGFDETLTAGGRGGAGDRRGNRLHSGLVAAQTALAFALLAGAGLFIKSFQRLISVDTGFDTDKLVVMYVDLPDRYGSSPESQSRFFEELCSDVASIPGVAGVATVEQIPYLAGLSAPPTWIETEKGFEEHAIHWSRVTPSYLGLMGIPVVAGRGLAAADGPGAPPVTLVNQTMARTVWPDKDPIGRRIRIIDGGQETVLTVVGVVGDIRYGPGWEPFPEYYQSSLQFPGSSRSVVVKTAVEPSSLLGPVGEALRRRDPDIPAPVGVLDELIRSSPSLTLPRFGAVAIGLLALIACSLAVIGVYAALAFTVARRTSEIGLRMALGAKRGDVHRAVLLRGLRLTGVGLVIGLAVALAGGRVLESVLYGIRPSDPATLAQVALLVLGAACAAGLVPAWRATKVDPIEALRHE